MLLFALDTYILEALIFFFFFFHYEKNYDNCSTLLFDLVVFAIRDKRAFGKFTRV